MAAAVGGAGRRRRAVAFGLQRAGGRGVVLEIGGIPAAAFQLETGGGDQLGQRRLAAGRAIGQRGG